MFDRSGRLAASAAREHALATRMLEVRNPQEAVFHALAAIDLFAQVGDPFRQAECEELAGRALLRVGSHAHAALRLRAAIDGFAAYGEVDRVAACESLLNEPAEQLRAA